MASRIQSFSHAGSPTPQTVRIRPKLWSVVQEFWCLCLSPLAWSGTRSTRLHQTDRQNASWSRSSMGSTHGCRTPSTSSWLRQVLGAARGWPATIVRLQKKLNLFRTFRMMDNLYIRVIYEEPASPRCRLKRKETPSTHRTGRRACSPEKEASWLDRCKFQTRGAGCRDTAGVYSRWLCFPLLWRLLQGSAWPGQGNSDWNLLVVCDCFRCRIIPRLART